MAGLMIRILDRNRNVKKYLDRAVDPQWTYELPGGCKDATFTIIDSIASALNYIGRMFRVEFWYTGTLVWAGYIENARLQLPQGQGQRIVVECVGYRQALATRLVSPTTYTGIDAGLAISGQLGLFLGKGAPSPLADISVGAVAAAGYTLENFQVTQKDLQSTVNDLALCGVDGSGNPYEWLVDENRQFYYRVPVTTPTQFAWVGRDILSLELLLGPSSDIKNYLYVNGAVGTDGVMAKADGAVTNSTSIATYGQLDGTLRLSSYSSSNDLTRAAGTALGQVATGQDRLQMTVFRSNDSLKNCRAGDVWQVQGVAQGIVYTYKAQSVAMSLANGLQAQIQLGATMPDLQDLFRRAVAYTDANLTEMTRQSAHGGNAGVFPLTVGRSILAPSSAIPT